MALGATVAQPKKKIVKIAKQDQPEVTHEPKAGKPSKKKSVATQTEPSAEPAPVAEPALESMDWVLTSVKYSTSAKKPGSTNNPVATINKTTISTQGISLPFSLETLDAVISGHNDDDCMTLERQQASFKFTASWQDNTRNAKHIYAIINNAA
jgi:hypothetical protein